MGQGTGRVGPASPCGGLWHQDTPQVYRVGPRSAFLVAVVREMTGWGEGGFVEQQGSFAMRSICVRQVLVSGESRCLGLWGRGQSAALKCP